MTNAYEDSEDARLTREVVRSVMAESRGVVSTQQEAGDEDSDDEMVRELEREMIARAQGSSASPEGPAPEESDSDTLARLLEGVRCIEETE